MSFIFVITIRNKGNVSTSMCQEYCPQLGRGVWCREAGGRAWQEGPLQRTVRILLECILMSIIWKIIDAPLGLIHSERTQKRKFSLFEILFFDLFRLFFDLFRYRLVWTGPYTDVSVPTFLGFSQTQNWHYCQLCTSSHIFAVSFFIFTTFVSKGRLDTNECNRITFQGCKLHWSSFFLAIRFFIYIRTEMSKLAFSSSVHAPLDVWT